MPVSGTLVVNPNPVQAGQTLGFSFTVRNQGTAAVNVTTTTRVRLSASASAPSTSDPLLASLPTPPLAAGASVPLNGSGTVPASLAPGTYYVWVIVDADNAVAGQNTANDRLAVPVTVGGAGTPDLVPVSGTLVVSPNPVQAGQTLGFSFTVRNQGTAAVNVTTTTRVRLSASASAPSTSDPLLASLPTPPLAAGASVPLNGSGTVPASLAPGTYYVWVTVDADNAVAGQNTANDRLAVPVTVGGAGTPDLVPVSGTLVVSPNPVQAGQTLGFSFTVRNQGTAAVNVTTTTRVRLSASASAPSTSDPLLASLPTPPLAAGASVPLNGSGTVPASLAPGTYYVWVIVDADNAVAGQNTANDRLAVPVTVGGAGTPDLVPVSGTLVVSPNPVQAGQTLGFSFTVRNQGTAAVNVTTTTRVRLSASASAPSTSDPLLASLPTPPLAAGASVPLNGSGTVPASLAPGTYYVWVIVDADNAVAGQNTANDRLAVPVTVTASTPAPVVTQAVPNQIPQGISYQNVTLQGSGFTASSYHQFSIDGGAGWSWATAAPTYNGPTSLTVAVNNTVARTIWIRVCASQGSTQCSGSVTVTVTASTPAPVVTQAVPNQIPQGISYQNVTLQGSGFTASSYHQFSIDGGARWDWATAAPTYNGPTSLTVAVNNTVARTIWIRVCASQGSTQCSGSVTVTIVAAENPTLESSLQSGPQGTTFFLQGYGYTPRGAVQRYLRQPSGTLVDLGSVSADSPALRFPWTLICDKENQDVQRETLGFRARARSPEGD
ncbi:MAG: hypothetical protein KatS3mg005_0787 [Bryobacteraceae bacterium]|nr:MAG: hypothetical protein KatS3mg005_0787 [Bryobacteraceae bacterium]